MSRIRILWLGLSLLVAATVAMYALNPFNANSRDPRARVLGLLPYRIPSRSMEPTLDEGAFVVANVATLRNRDPQVGEIVVFRYPPNPQVQYVKRVVAVGGMTFEMRKGVVYLDGKVLAEPWLPNPPLTKTDVNGSVVQFLEDDIYSDVAPFRVPEHQFFMLGDSRGNSEDSRSWGLVSRELVIGSVTRVF